MRSSPATDPAPTAGSPVSSTVEPSSEPAQADPPAPLLPPTPTVAQPVAQPIPHAFAVPAAVQQAAPGGVARPDLPRLPGGLLSVSTRSVADALSGIRLPCDLVPLIGLKAEIDPTHVVFATDGHPAGEVGSRVGDELERIGCELTQIDETTLHAVRDSYVIEVRIHPDAASAKGPAGRRFPTAAPRSVVVEFRIV